MPKLPTDIVLQVKDLYSKDLAVAERKFDAFGTNIASAVKTGAVAATAAIAGVTVALGAMVTATANAGDEVQKMSLKLGVSAETLSELKFAAEIGGASMEDIEKGMKRLAKVASDASFGLETYQRVFRELGVQFEDGNGRLRDLDAIFNDTVRALNGLSSETRKAALVQDLFGRSGLNLLPMLKGNEQGISALQQRAHELRITFTELEANQAADFKDALAETKAAFSGLYLTLAKDLIPTFTQLFNSVTDYIVKNDTLIDGIHTATAAFRGFLTVLGFDVTPELEKIGRLRVEIEKIRKSVQDNERQIFLDSTSGSSRRIQEAYDFTIATRNLTAYLEKQRAELARLEQAYIDEHKEKEKNTTATRENTEAVKKAAAERKKAELAIKRSETALASLTRQILVQKGLKEEVFAMDVLAFQQGGASADQLVEFISLKRELIALQEREHSLKKTGTSNMPDENARQQAALEAEAQRLADEQRRRDEIQLATDSESEILNIHTFYLEQRALIEDKFANDSMAREQALARLKTQLAAQSFGAAANFMQNLTVIAGQEGGAMFEVMKGLASAQALIDTYAAAQAAYKALAGIPVVGPGLAAAAAASAVAAGLARVAAIQRTEPGATAGNAIGAGGTTTPGYTGGANTAGPPPVPVTQADQPAPIAVQVNVYNPLGNEDWDKIYEENIVPAIERGTGRKVGV